MLLAARSAPGSGDINQTAKKLLQKLLITRPATTREQQQLRRWQQLLQPSQPSPHPLLQAGAVIQRAAPGTFCRTLCKNRRLSRNQPCLAKLAIIGRCLGNLGSSIPRQFYGEHYGGAASSKWGYRYVSATLLLTASVFLFSHPLQFIPALPHHNCYLQYPHMLGGEADILPTSI